MIDIKCFEWLIDFQQLDENVEYEIFIKLERLRDELRNVSIEMRMLK